MEGGSGVVVTLVALKRSGKMCTEPAKEFKIVISRHALQTLQDNPLAMAESQLHGCTEHGFVAATTVDMN